jgi:hypothetical protein
LGSLLYSVEQFVYSDESIEICCFADQLEVWTEEPQTGVISGNVYSLCRNHDFGDGSTVTADW